MSTALAVRPPLTPDVWSMIQAVAPVMKSSRLFGVASDEQAAAIMLKGYELGLSLSASFEFVHVIEGRPSISPRGALALILNSPMCEGVEIKDEYDQAGAPFGCVVTMKRRGGLTYTARFTLDDAKRAGLLKDGSGWAKYPAQMCKWRAVGFAADVVFPDVLNGMKRADEFGADLDPSGEVIDGTWQQVGSQPPKPSPAPTSQPDPVARLNALVAAYGAAAIINANGGRIPASNDEIDAVEAALTAVSQ